MDIDLNNNFVLSGSLSLLLGIFHMTVRQQVVLSAPISY